MVKPSAANFCAIAEPMKSPAPITAAVALRLVKGGPPEEPDGLMYNRLAGKPNQIGVARRAAQRCWSMIRKSGRRFSEKIMLKKNAREG